MANNSELPGFAQVQAQLQVPNLSDPLDLDKILVFKEATFKENVFTGSSEYTFTYATTSLDFVEKAIKACELSGTPLLKFRWGYGSATNTRWIPWQNGIIKQATAVPMNIGKNAGHNVMLSVADSLYAVARAKKTAIRKGLISDIVNQIASDNGLQAVVEPTQNQFFYIQSFIDDVTFIAARLQPRAANARGYGNYLFYVRDNVLHFHTPDYQASYSEFHYYSQPTKSMGQNDLGQLLFNAGVSGTHLVLYDPYTASMSELPSDPTKALRMEDALPQFSSVINSEHKILYHLSENRPEESINIGQNTYERARMNTFKTTVSTDKVFDVRAGNFMNLVISPVNNKASTASGVYLVMDTTYLVKEGAITALFTLTRGETSTTVGQLSAAAPDQQLVPQTQAPGHLINLKDMQNSQLTKGAATASSNNTTYSDVLDPDTAPGAD